MAGRLAHAGLLLKPSGTPQFLDSYTANLWGVWGLRRLLSSYSSNLIRIRRSSDNTEQDIGYDSNGDLDVAAIATFVGTNNGFVTKLYDQSGNTRDLAQATSASQPQIVNAGAIYGYVVYDKSNDILRSAANFSSGVSKLHTFLRGFQNDLTTSNTFKEFWDINGTSSDNVAMYYEAGSVNKFSWTNTQGGSGATAGERTNQADLTFLTDMTIDCLYDRTVTGNTNRLVMGKDGVAIPRSGDNFGGGPSTAYSPATFAQQPVSLGARINSGTSAIEIPSDLRFRCLAMYTDTKVSQRQSIADIINRANDTYWRKVVTLLTMDGANNGTVFEDKANRQTWTVDGNAKTSTAQSKFGGSSAVFDGTGDHIHTASSSDFDFNGNDMTFECWFRGNDVTTNVSLMEFYKTAGSGTAGRINFTIQSGQIYLVSIRSGGTTDILVGPVGSLSTGTWYHVAATKQGTTWRLYLDGVLLGTATNSSFVTGNMFLSVGGGSSLGTSGDFNGYIDDVRVTKGVARYTGSSFTVPTAANDWR